MDYRTRIDRIGKTNTNKYGSKMTIVEYNNANNIVVKFEDGHTVNSAYKEFKKGIVSNPYDKTVYGVGYLGIGKYQVSKDKEFNIRYKHWNSMLQRCYDEQYHNKRISYSDCKVCEEWHNFQAFAEWYDENYYTIGNEKMCLDKDILNKGNKVYSPNNCIFVPEYINTLFCKRQNDRGEYPIGVSIHKKTGHFEARCSTLEGRIYLGVYDTPTQAYKVYKNYKEKYIKKMADIYKGKIPIELYKAMYKYKVDIND